MNMTRLYLILYCIIIAEEKYILITLALLNLETVKIMTRIMSTGSSSSTQWTILGQLQYYVLGELLVSCYELIICHKEVCSYAYIIYIYIYI